MLVSSQKMPLSNDITSSIPFSFYFFPSILLCVCVCLFIHRRIVSFRDDGKGPFLFLLCRLFAAVFERLKISPIRSLRSFTMFWVLYSIRGRKPVNELLCLSLLSQLYRSVSGIRGGKSPYDMCAATILYTILPSGAILGREGAQCKIRIAPTSDRRRESFC